MTMINFAVLPDMKRASRPGASRLRISLLQTPLPAFSGTGVPAAGIGAGTPDMVAYDVPRVRSKVAFVAPPRAAAVASQLGQANSHNYMTRVNAVGEGASGPASRPPDPA